MEKFIGSHNEWDKLEEVILGNVSNAQKPTLTRDQLAIEYPQFINEDNPSVQPFSDKVIEETKEDLDNLQSQLEKLGIKVRRPKDVDYSKTIKTPDWETDGFYGYCPRDSVLVIGDKLIEAPMTMRARLLEQYALKDIMMDYFTQGAHWISAPKPELLDRTYSFDQDRLALTNYEPIFDAANVLRAGEDLFYLVSNTGNELGAKWLERTIGDKYNIHLCRDIYDGIHIDSTISLLRPGLVLLNPERVTEENIPEPLKKWNKIWCPEMVDSPLTEKNPLSSKWLGMNLIMLAQDLALVDSKQEHLIRLLNKNGIEVMGFDLRHSRTLGGGFHCSILDTKRKSKLEKYF